MAGVLLSTGTISGCGCQPICCTSTPQQTPLCPMPLPSRLSTEPGWAISLHSELNRRTKMAKSEGSMHPEGTSKVTKGATTLTWSLDSPTSLEGPYALCCMGAASEGFAPRAAGRYSCLCATGSPLQSAQLWGEPEPPSAEAFLDLRVTMTALREADVNAIFDARRSHRAHAASGL